jgi:thiamine kinase-like enzyme
MPQIHSIGKMLLIQVVQCLALRPILSGSEVCHTDLHGENLMVDDRGNLYILDWETAMIAPPEHDLFFFAGYDSF